MKVLHNLKLNQPQAPRLCFSFCFIGFQQRDKNMKVICVAPERGLWEADHLNNYCHSEHHSPSLTPSVCLSVCLSHRQSYKAEHTGSEHKR